VFIKTIDLTNFKSYSSGHFEFSPILNVIYGNNGVGKTNLLDAIYTLAMTRSNFLTTDAQLIKDDASFYRLEGMLCRAEEQYKVVLKLAQGKKKVIERDQLVIRRPIEHIGFIPVVMITPDDLNLINASNIERRKLADSTLAQIDHDYLEQLVIYNRLIKQRNTLLKQGLEQRGLDLALLDTYDRRLDEPAHIIFSERKKFFSNLQEYVQQYYERLSAGREHVSLKYRSALEEGGMTELCRRYRAKDRATGRTNQGVHRDSIDCLIDGRDARIFASQGQKKSLVFAMKLAQLNFMRAKLSDNPILLLDDIFDRLDQQRVKRLLQIILADAFGQIFITDTQWQRFGDIVSNFAKPFEKIEIV
jgi:DNA replication and repair protein RecF